MGTDIIDAIESLDSRKFSDYEYLTHEIRNAINSFDDANTDQLSQDKDHDGFEFRANSIDYIKSLFFKTLTEFVHNFFYNEELIRDVVKNKPEVLDSIKYSSFTYFGPLFSQKQSIGQLEWGPTSLDKTAVWRDYFKNNYKSGYYLKPKKSAIVTESKEGCFIATFAYESYEHEKVLKLRLFRDEIISKSILGRLFIKAYYQLSPTMVKVLNKIMFPKSIIKGILNGLIILITKVK